MLAKGIQLTIMIGPVVPIPVPQVVMDALDIFEVTIAAGSRSGFQMKLQCNSRSTLNQIFVVLGAMTITPVLRVMFIVTLNGTPQPLFDGVLTHVEMQLGSQSSAGTITVTGEDLCSAMDGIDWSGLPFSAMPIEARVALICAKYAPFGIIPLIIPTVFFDAPIPIEEIPAQEDTDLDYIKTLAAEVGYKFYIEPGPVPGTNVAYFGPEIKVGVPQPVLNVDMD